MRNSLVLSLAWLAFAAVARAEALPPCSSGPPDPTAVNPALMVTINPATAWQPRSGEVLVEVRANPATLAGFRVRACLGLSGGNQGSVREAVVRMRPSDVMGSSISASSCLTCRRQRQAGP
jgi:hypothetical protein